MNGFSGNISNAASSNSDDTGGFFDDFKSFIAHPWHPTTMDAGDWFLMIGLIVSFLIAWKMIFTHIQEAI